MQARSDSAGRTLFRSPMPSPIETPALRFARTQRPPSVDETGSDKDAAIMRRMFHQLSARLRVVHDQQFISTSAPLLAAGFDPDSFGEKSLPVVGKLDELLAVLLVLPFEYRAFV